MSFTATLPRALIAWLSGDWSVPASANRRPLSSPPPRARAPAARSAAGAPASTQATPASSHPARAEAAGRNGPHAGGPMDRIDLPGAERAWL